MRSRWMMLILIPALLGVLANAACGGHGRAPVPSAEAAGGGPRLMYLALGDSLAVGVGASDRTQTGYVPLFHQSLRGELGEDLELRNLGVSGETSRSFLDRGQLDRALETLRRNADDSRGNDVQVITLSIGGNDLLALVAPGGPCAPPVPALDPSCLDPATRAIADYTANLTTILQSLRAAAGPDTRILVLTVMNPYSGTGAPVEAAGDVGVGLLNQQITAVAGSAAVAASVGDVASAFAARGPELTHLSDPRPDFHPNDAGYRVIADVLMATYRR